MMQLFLDTIQSKTDADEDNLRIMPVQIQTAKLMNSNYFVKDMLHTLNHWLTDQGMNLEDF